MISNDLLIPLGLLCCYGFFKEFRPSEPFLTEYLINPRWGDITKNDLYSKVYPVYTYATFALVLPVFILTDFLKYKPVIVLEGVAYIVTWILLLWGNGVTAMQMMELSYGIAVSTEVSYYTYIYAQTTKKYYRTVSSLTRASILFGRFLSGFFSQLLSDKDVLDYHELNYVSLGSVIVAFVFSLLLPTVSNSIYFDRDVSNITPQNTEATEKTTQKDELDKNAGTSKTMNRRQSFTEVVSFLWQQACQSYSSLYIIKWSFWVIISTCINYQVGNYIQPLWEEITPSTNSSGSDGESFVNTNLRQSFESFHQDHSHLDRFEGDDKIYNGYVEAATTLLGALAVSFIGFIGVDWAKVGDLAALLISIVSGVLLFVIARTKNIWMGYIGYSIFRILYQMLMTVSSFEIVKKLDSNGLDCYALVFGINMFCALGIQTVLTVIVNDTFELGPRPQFIVYSTFFIVPFSFYLLNTFRRFCRHIQAYSCKIP